MASTLGGIRGFFRWLLGSGGLKRTILVPFLCLILAGFLSGWVLYLRGSRQALFEAVDSLVAQTAARAGDSVADYLGGAAALATVNSTYFGSLADPAASHEAMRELFWRELGLRSDLDIVSVGFSDGEYAEAQRMSEGYVRVGEAGRATGGDLVLQRTDARGDPLYVELRRPGYDPRTRPWYQRASLARGAVFTSPYAIASTGELAIAAVAPYRIDGRLRAVATTDLSLTALSSFMSKIDSLQGGLGAMADQDGFLLASSDGSGVVDREGERIYAIGEGSLRGRLFGKAAATPPGRVFAYAEGTARMRAIALDRDVGVGQRWRILVALPESRFTAPLRRTDTISLLVIFLMLAVSIFLAFLAAARVAAPLRQLSLAIESLELETAEPAARDSTPRQVARRLASRRDEIGALAAAFDAMGERLDESYASVKASLREKEILLKEVHHRVKNNLQIVSSMLSLEEGLVAEGGVAESFGRIQDRIQAMAFVHEDLYRSGDFGSVHMEAYLTRITESLTSTVRGGCYVEYRSRAADIELPLEKALPCGLIVNELVTNALKHAFVGRERGRVGVSLERHGPGLRLVVEDDGVGLAPAAGENGHEGIGSQLVPSLAEQLHGILARQSSAEGTRIELVFPA